MKVFKVEKIGYKETGEQRWASELYIWGARGVGGGRVSYWG